MDSLPPDPPAIVRPSDPSLDLSDPCVLAAARRPGSVHTAVGRVALAHDDQRGRAQPLARSVLLLHDDPIVLDLLRDALVSAGLVVVTATTPTEARLRLSHRRGPPPAVVVADYVLGHTTALDLLRELPREHRALVVSAHPDGARIARAVRPYAAFAPTPSFDDPAEVAAFVELVSALVADATPNEDT